MRDKIAALFASSPTSVDKTLPYSFFNSTALHPLSIKSIYHLNKYYKIAQKLTTQTTPPCYPTPAENRQEPNNIRNIAVEFYRCLIYCFFIIYHYIYCRFFSSFWERVMAFVIGKAEKKSLFQLDDQIQARPGPGAYSVNSNNSKDKQYCAPFNTSNAKISTFQMEETKYGPGSYEPKYFKDINKPDSNKGYVFASKVQRFSTQKDKPAKQNKSTIQQKILLSSRSKSQNKNQSTLYTFSPQKHNDNKQIYQQRLERSKTVMEEIRMQNHSKKVQSIKGKRQFIRVLLTSSTNTQNVQSCYIYRNTNGKTLGPGSYQNAEFRPKLKGVPNWNLDRNVRFKTENSKVPGPGSYLTDAASDTDDRYENEMLLKSKKRLSAAFASTVIRSHMDSLIYKTNIPFKAAILDDRRLKDHRPGPGSYNVDQLNKDKKSFNYNNETSFGLSERRILEGDGEHPGPGSYQLYQSNISRRQGKERNIIKQIRNQIFGKKGKIANNDNKNNSLTRSYMNKGSSFEPNFDNSQTPRERRHKRTVKFCSLQQRCFSKLGNMSQEERFKRKQTRAETQLGPGQYYNEKTDTSFSIGQWQKGTTSIFKSSTNRAVFQNGSQIKNGEIPFYNIVRNDIGFKAQKTRKYIENLKKINIEKSPFQTSSKRFNQNPHGEADLNMIMFEFENAQKKVVSEEKEIQPSSTFKSGTKREVFKGEEKPGPADYSLKMKNNGAYESLEKKSFNKNYGLLKDHPEQAKKTVTSSLFSRKNSKQRTIENKTVDPAATKKETNEMFVGSEKK